MSTYAALGGVSSSLQTLLFDRMEYPGGTTQPVVTVATPRLQREDMVVGAETPGINIFLYRVTENGYLANQEVPVRRTPGGTGRPPLCLDLHYLITAYGTTLVAEQGNDVLGQITLGSAMRVLYDNAILTDDMFTKTLLPKRPILDASVLGQFKHFKICLESFNLEELSKIWTALTLPYRLSAAYQVSLVQIDSTSARIFPQPVGEPPLAGPRVFVLPITTPRIDRINVVRLDDPNSLERPLPFARIGDTIVVRGSNLRGQGTTVEVAGQDMSAAVVQPALPDQVRITLPDDAALQPGPVAVRIVQVVEVGNPAQPRPWLYSNAAIFMLVPYVASVVPAAGVAQGDALTVNGRRLVQAGVDCQALIGDVAIQSDAFTISTGAQIQFPVPPGITAGNHAVRVRVGGAESFDAVSVTHL
jgi:hypothetical protein